MQNSNPHAHWAATHSGFYISHAMVSSIVIGIVAAMAGVFFLGISFAQYRFHHAVAFDPSPLLHILQQDKEKIAELQAQTTNQLASLNRQVGRIEAHITRINMLGEKLRVTLDADPLVYDFLHEPPLGERAAISPATEPLVTRLQTYEGQLQARMVQWEALLHRAHSTRAQGSVALKGSGNPVETGKISSYFGKRRDPLHGKAAWHAGVDIAGDEGANIKALAAGLVKFAGHKGGYGQLVEIDHGDGLISRYGHNQALFVQSGQVIHKGDIIASLGTSGRSTGPHVHLEIHKDGKPVDPGQYFSDLKRS